MSDPEGKKELPSKFPARLPEREAPRWEDGDLVDEKGRPVKAHALRISAPGGYLTNPSDTISREVTKVIARPELLAINKDREQVEYAFSLKAKSKEGENKHSKGLIVYKSTDDYTSSPEWGDKLVDPILGELLKEARNMDREDLFLHTLIMNELPRHGPDGFPLSLETIRRAKKTRRGRNPPRGAALAEELMALHRRLHRLARIAIYAPADVYISGRYFKGTPFQGGSLINVGHPISLMPTLAGKFIPAEWYIQPGSVGMFLCQEFGIKGVSPQAGIYPEAVFSLDLERREGAFRLALPLAQLWRIRAGRAQDMERTWIPRTLFETAGIPLPKSRQKNQQWLNSREADLEALVDCGLLHSWQWGPEWAADLASMPGGKRHPRGWFDRLLDEGRLILEPHPDILQRYADSGLPGAARYLAEFTQRPGVKVPTRPLPGPTRTPRRSRRAKS